MLQQDIANYWDAFAADYYTIQKESQASIAIDVADYLRRQKILPAKTLIDVGGGAGRYLKSLAPQVQNYTLLDISREMLKYAHIEAQLNKINNIEFVHQSIERFSQESRSSFEVVFSALNPAIDSMEGVLQLSQIAQKACVVIRLIGNRDTLFTPLERQLGLGENNPNIDPAAAETLAQAVNDLGYEVHRQQFKKDYSERIDHSLLRSYFDEVPDALFKNALATVANEQAIYISHTTLIYELLYWFV